MRKSITLALALFVLFAGSLTLSLLLGSEALAPGKVFATLWHHFSLGRGASPDPTTDAIVWFIRLPRALLALLVGGGLAVIGVGMQTLVRNPLAEPYILGISSGASAGVSLFYLGFVPSYVSSMLSLPTAAFLGGLVSITIVYLVARDGSSISVGRLLLAGVAMSSLMGAVGSLVTFASPNPDKLRTVLFLLLGSLNRARWDVILVPALVSILGALILTALSRPLDAMLLGEEPAFNLGVPVETTKRLLIFLAALVTGTLVSVSGAIGFVGLIVPHVVRSWTGVLHRRLLPLSFIAGALFLLWADVAARFLIPSQELPVGIVTALCGVPFFLFLLRRHAYRFG